MRCVASEADPRWQALCTPKQMKGLWVALEGPLGAGKSSLVRTWLRSMGVMGPIPSPTYSLCEYYSLPAYGTVLHIDAYRLECPEDWDALALDAYSDASVWIEWCSKAPWMLERCDVVIVIEEEGLSKRSYALQAQSPRGAAWREAARAAFAFPVIP